jgi:predicted nucleic acid-binding Zn ribbon protein
MPIYEYRRPDGTTFEIQQPFSDDALTVDPDTGVPVERVLHPPAVHFKGKGFYNTDYGTRNRQRETAAAGEGSSSSERSSTEGPSSGGDSSGGDSSGRDSSGGDSSGSSSEGKAKGETGKDSAKPKGSGSKDSKPVAAKS